MDESETAIIATSHVAGAMNYPSTTQALFALIVMIIVLVFILVYCCWGTFTCARQRQEDAAAPATEDRAGPNGQQVRHILRGPHTVIVPINNMIYVGDPETHQIYQIPLDRDKPPAYTEVYRAGPPPPYRPDIVVSDSEVSSCTTTHMEHGDNITVLPENPPTYDESLSAAPVVFGAGHSSSVASDPPPQQQQQQEATAASETAMGTAGSTITQSSQSPAPEPPQEVQEPPPPRAGLVLTLRTLPQVVQQASLQPSEEGSSATPVTHQLQ
ncbi:hypothetical protein GWK47_051989 [Chionoecetes opilio]|uniref:Uncharacterized protein n=1 Tax=Chionoecetes opilio TaxID=41210 RepID=A0A8J5CRP2_CHIOP|nr:hypothetical protein GWK47_051989 [Chionoecetes opilio]